MTSSQRVSLQGKDGVIRNLAESMNTMCENVGKVMDDLVGMLGALAAGDLTAAVSNRRTLSATFATLKDSANVTATQLSDTVARIKSAAEEVTNASAEISTSTTDLSATHRRTGGKSGRNLRVDGGDLRDRQEKRRKTRQHANALTAETRRGGRSAAAKWLTKHGRSNVAN